jgi:glucose-1-phosphate cytidylyltransferase
MKVIILCGGFGTRLREETEFRPKPLVEIGGRPILWHIMKIYAHFGFRDFVLCLGYRGNMIKEHFLNYEAMNSNVIVYLGRESRVEYLDAHEEQDFRVTLVDTGLETMTGGRVKGKSRNFYLMGKTALYDGRRSDAIRLLGESVRTRIAPAALAYLVLATCAGFGPVQRSLLRAGAC